MDIVHPKDMKPGEIGCDVFELGNSPHGFTNNGWLFIKTDENQVVYFSGGAVLLLDDHFTRGEGYLGAINLGHCLSTNMLDLGIKIDDLE